MAIRKIVFQVTANSITPNTVQNVGVQSEHNATQLEFVLADQLYQDLQNECVEGESLLYRFDCADGIGNSVPFEPQSLTSATVIFPIEEMLSRNGGRAKVYLVITKYNQAEETTLELLSRPAELRFDNKPAVGKENGKSEQSLSVLADVAKRAALTAERYAAEAIEAQEKTELSKFEMEEGTTVIFRGGNASSNFDIDLKVDSTLSENSNNPVSNKVIVEELKKVVSVIYPVGTLYWSSEPTNPSELFGGSWKQIKDTFILAAGDTYTTVDDTIRGETEVTLDEEQMPRHRHKSLLSKEGNKLYGLVENGGWDGSVKVTWGNGTGNVNDIELCGGDKPHNNMPPYIVRYCWERIA